MHCSSLSKASSRASVKTFSSRLADKKWGSCMAISFAGNDATHARENVTGNLLSKNQGNQNGELTLRGVSISDIAIYLQSLPESLRQRLPSLFQSIDGLITYVVARG